MGVEPFQSSLRAGRGGRGDTVAILRYLAALKDRAEGRPTPNESSLPVARCRRTTRVQIPKGIW